jgi:anti-anti-sigma regulatory factor
MRPIFKLATELRGDALFIFLAGEFDGDSAWQLTHTLTRASADIRRITVDTRRIFRVNPFGAALFSNLLNRSMIDDGRIFLDAIPVARAKAEGHRLFSAAGEPAPPTWGCRSRSSIR